MAQVETRAVRPVAVRSTLDEHEAVSRLGAAVEAHQRVDLVTYEKILSMVIGGYGPNDIARAVGQSLVEVQDKIQELARHLTVKRDAAEESVTLLVAVEPSAEVLAGLTSRKRRRVEERMRKMRAAVPVPLVWEARTVPHGVRRAVKALRTRYASDVNLTSEVLLFELRTKPPLFELVTQRTLEGVRKVADLGVLTDVTNSAGLTSQMAASLKAAYVTLDAVRRDSVSALQELLREGSEDLETLAVRAQPVADGPVGRFRQALDGITAFSDPQAATARALRKLKAEITNENLPTSVGTMTAGQVLRVGTALGLPAADAGLAQVREAAARLEAKGVSDTTVLKQLWSLAYSASKEDAFWAAVDRLQDGDVDWVDELK